MIFTNILLGLVILFFGVRLILAVRENMKKNDKICLISKKTGKVVHLNREEMFEFMNKEIQEDFSYTAQALFKKVTTAFAEGNLSELKSCLSESALNIFKGAIEERVAKKQKMEFALIGFKDVKVLEDTPDKKVVLFTTEQVNLLKDEKEKVIEGDTLYVATITEKWTFTQPRANHWHVSGVEQQEASFA